MRIVLAIAIAIAIGTIICLAVLLLRRKPKNRARARPAPKIPVAGRPSSRGAPDRQPGTPSRDRSVEHEQARIEREMAVETERLLREIDAQADQLVSELVDDQLAAGLVDEEEYEPEEEYEDQEDASDPPADLSLSRSNYLSPEQEAIALRPGHDGLPDLRLAPLSDRMVLVTSTGELINPRSRALYKVGIYAFVVRGTSYYRGAKTGDFRPGAEVTLMREPDNQHDPHAIAVYAANSKERAGYVNKLNAKRLARLIDAGSPIQAIAVRGARPGIDDTPHVLACEAALMARLRRPE